MSDRIFGWDLPPGVSAGDIPGNEPETQLVEFLAAYDDNTWTTHVFEVPVSAAKSTASALAWIHGPAGVSSLEEYRRVVLWAVYSWSPADTFDDCD